MVLPWSWLSLFLIIALEVWAISLFFFYFESFMCLSFFSIAPYFFLAYENFGEKDSYQMNGVFILVDEKTYFCVTLSVRVIILFVGIRESWSWVHDENLNKGHNNFRKLNVNTNSIWLRFCYHGFLSYGFGRNCNHLRSMLIEILIL